MRINYKKVFNLRTILSSPKQLFALTIFILLIFFIQGFIATNSSFEGKVVKVIDGDTIEVQNGKKLEKIRFFAIDAPESKQIFGKEARNFLAKMIQGQRVQIIYKDKDKYDRIIAIVKLKGKDINSIMVRTGHAWAYSYYSNLYVKEQKQAQKEKIGLWKGKNPIEPYKWRKQNKL
ncbi:thermonuclease family protein [Campylobacter sp. MIT 21-1685]|uniref:thermonuclease family protein n=1 Tax=unclassified Campylobacter TaxID=2593542 RepID=UPI00224AA79D|nr:MULTISPECIES: thermonuclease family protein [unclassified Campylobacter]MCX2683106.1 thermonuclease family protein [Campylobacter sp. MIT 21-1684]MCX2751434.1 thermonuclease family protein [Campylobacter sp. MIT 21-1682]MCX2807634.1 thermonuclease family protein [Campylobacter sp. MIT 21-1685]